MLENVRGPITEHVFTYACEIMPGGFADLQWEKPTLNQQLYHVNLKFSL